MSPWALMLGCLMLLLGPMPGQTDPKSPQNMAQKPPTSQPSTRPAQGQTTLRRPPQAEILEKLLDRQVAPPPVLPREAGDRRRAEGPGPHMVRDKTGAGLLVEGTILVERAGRLVVGTDRDQFVFNADEGAEGLQTMGICPNQLLEAMEEQAESGNTEFIISAEVTRYHGQNYLLIRKVLRRVPNGNLNP